MTTEQADAFCAAAGFAASSLRVSLRLWVGSVALICAVLILAGLFKLLHSPDAWDKTVFLGSLLSLSFWVTLVFITLA